MKKKYKLTLVLLGSISTLCIFLCILRNRLKIEAVGVIGGADGPTDIVITKASYSSVLLYIITGVFCTGFIAFMLIALKKKE